MCSEKSGVITPAVCDQASNDLQSPATNPACWHLDSRIDFLNHGSFGACPKAVLEYQRDLQERLEREPVKFFVDEFERLWDAARSALAQFLGAKSADLVFVPNATSGVNAVLRSLRFKRGEELLVTDYEYNACRNVLNHVARMAGAKVVVVKLPFPVKAPTQLTEAILARVTRRTRIALLDHVTSQTAVTLPMAELVRELDARGVDTLVDGAHAPGMIELNLQKLGAAYYTGNCHKWLCAPKGAAFLHVRQDKQKLIRPPTISHGANSARTDRTRFLIEFGWMGTTDPAAMLSVPEALRFMSTLLPRGWKAIRERNRTLALAAREVLCGALEIAKPCPDEMIGAMAAFPIPDFSKRELANLALQPEPLRGRLVREFGIEVPSTPWPAPPKRLLRISAQIYNSLPQYERLASVLKVVFNRRRA
jgi:isopenicillin-N epimerase